MAHAMMCLAEAHAALSPGCAKTFTAPKLAKAGRPLPWVLGLGTTTIIAEPWSHLHKLHRRKRGFRFICDRLRVLIASVNTTPTSSAITLQVWEDEGTIDRPLLEKVARHIEVPIHVFGPDEIRETIHTITTDIPTDLRHHHNPILSVLGWITSWNS
jgi:hypothetical protein